MKVWFHHHPLGCLALDLHIQGLENAYDRLADQNFGLVVTCPCVWQRHHTISHFSCQFFDAYMQLTRHQIVNIIHLEPLTLRDFRGRTTVMLTFGADHVRKRHQTLLGQLLYNNWHLTLNLVQNKHFSSSKFFLQILDFVLLLVFSSLLTFVFINVISKAKLPMCALVVSCMARMLWFVKGQCKLIVLSIKDKFLFRHLIHIIYQFLSYIFYDFHE